MAALITVIALVGVLIGFVGVIVPILPGSTLIGASILVWGVMVPSWPARSLAAAAIAILVVVGVIQYVVAGKHMKSSGVPNRTLLIAAVAAIIGFFVVPVVGLILGFVLGVFMAERFRLGSFQAAGPSTVAAVKAVAISVGIEIAGALAAVTLWLVAVGVAWPIVNENGILI